MLTKACIFHDTDSSVHDRRIFEIVEEAYGRRARVVIFAGSEERAQNLDKCLWILRQDSFIPHKILGNCEEAMDVPVAIILHEWRPFHDGILVADGHCSIEFAFGFSIIHEFVYRTSPDIQEKCRNRFREYRERGIPVEYLKTGVWKGSMPKQ